MSSSQSIKLSYSSDSLVSVDAHREGLKIELVLESTLTNDSIFGGDGYLHAAERFNAQAHEARIEYEAQQILIGDVVLKEVSWSSGELSYTITVEEQSAGWAHNAAEARFSEFEVDFSMELCKEEIVTRWAQSEPLVNFIAVHRDSYEYEQSSVSTEAVRVIRSIDQYHPFLHVATLIEKIAESGGYQICSEFMDGDEFRSLYISGAYSSGSSSSLALEYMGFYAERLEDSETVADAFGRVFMTPYYAVNSVGNIIDIESIEQNTDCYNRGGCLSINDGVIEYRPLSTVDVGFEIRLNYITEYQIESRDKLKGFDCFSLTLGQDIKFDLINNFEDRRESVSSNFDYLLVLFDYDDEMIYRVRAYLEDGVSAVTLMTISSKSDHVTTPTYAIDSLFIECAASAWSDWQSYEGDWAIYDGYLEYQGVTEVDVTLRIAASECSPTSPFTFSTPYMSGAESGWEFTLKAGSSMTPYFTNYPGEGEIIEFADIAKHDISQSVFFESIAHLYNLRFYSDNTAKVLYIEPYDTFYGGRNEWDWSDRIVSGEVMILEDASAEVNRRHKWGYQGEDGYTNRLNSDTGEVEEYGSWWLTLGSYIAADATATHLNQLFSPSYNDDDDLLIVGDRDDVELTDSLDFSARVVRVDGMMTYDKEQMPYITFHSPERQISLCFEDRDGVVGLNQHYLNEMAYVERGRLVTLSLNLSVEDMNALLSPCEGKAFIWDTFKLTLGGEPSKARLRDVESFDPALGVAKCKFIIID